MNHCQIRNVVRISVIVVVGFGMGMNILVTPKPVRLKVP